MELGELVSFYRRRAGLTIDELAEKSGVPKSTINKIIGGVTRAPTLENVRAIARALGVKLSDFDDDPAIPDMFSPSERSHIQKFRSLDQHGKEAVVTILDCEIKRMNRGQEVVELTPDIKVLKIAGRDGSFREIRLTEEQRSAFHAYLNQLQLQDASDIL